MSYSPKHLYRRRRGRKRLIKKVVIGICLVGIITCAGFILTRNVPGEKTISEAESSAELITPSEDVSVVPETTSEASFEIVTETPESKTEPEPLYTEEDLTAMVKTLAGECYDCEIQDKYNVAWAIINRVRNGGFGGNTVLQVVSSPSQFCGYWHQSRAISDSDYAVAKDVLTACYAGEDAPVDYLYFSSNGGTTNIFR